MSARSLIPDLRCLCLALLLVLLGAPAAAAALSPVTQVEGISEYRLANGMRVLLAPDPSKPSTTVNITYLVGSRHENYGETGMAHLLEHLLFKGTPKNPDIDSEFTRRAMMSNATTWFDRTNYFETFPASNANLQWALQMEADRMLHARLRKADLDSEMPVVRNEMEGGENDGFTILLQRMAATAYLWHNYGKDTIGARSDVEHVDIDRLRAFYQRYYQPDNAVLVIAGRFDEARAKQWVVQYFGALPKPARKLPRLYTREPQQDGEREVTLRRAGDTQLLGALYHVPDGAHPDSAALALLL
ncbi:MAG: insulinase family protein, partial [Neisseriaceae bacterium]